MPVGLSGPTAVEYTVAAVAQRLGLATATLRSWTRRYGIGPSSHEPGTHRHYTESDIATLERMLQLIRAGATPASAARAATETGPISHPTFGDVTTIVEAAFRLDSERMDAVFRASVFRDGVLDTWDKLCRPALTAVMQQRAPGDECIDVEHVLSRSILIALQRVETVVTDTRAPVVLACTNGEFHTLPLEALRAVLAERGVSTRMLGASVPTSAVRDSLQRGTAARAMILWSQSPATAKVSALRRAGSTGATVLAAGPGWDGVNLPAGVVRSISLDDAAGRLS